MLADNSGLRARVERVEVNQRRSARPVIVKFFVRTIPGEPGFCVRKPLQTGRLRRMS
jgi:hypothetical protein